MEITDSEYEEYLHLKGVYTRDLIQKSIDSVVRLEDDIDTPVKRCVMAFSLLGCSPQWSCCGFDYSGQPIHKHHQYGRCYFVMSKNQKSSSILYEFINSDCANVNEWNITTLAGVFDLHTTAYNTVHQWREPNCIHYSETGVIKIEHLERFLLSLRDRFMDEVVLTDTNSAYKKFAPNWQYPPKSDWVIRKSDLV